MIFCGVRRWSCHREVLAAQCGHYQKLFDNASEVRTRYLLPLLQQGEEPADKGGIQDGADVDRETIRNLKAFEVGSMMEALYADGAYIFEPVPTLYDPNEIPKSPLDLHVRMYSVAYLMRCERLASFSLAKIAEYGRTAMRILQFSYPALTSMFELRCLWKKRMRRDILDVVPYMYSNPGESTLPPPERVTLRTAVINLFTWTNGTEWGTCMDALDIEEWTEVTRLAPQFPYFMRDVLLYFGRINPRTEWGT